MMEADFELAQRLQAEEQGEITIEERSRLFVELMNRRKKHFAKLRTEEIRRKPPTKTQKRNQMSTYLKNMTGYKHNQLKSKNDNQKEEEMKKHIEIVKDDEVRIDVTPLAIKPPVIVKYKIVKEGKFMYFQLIRADGSLKRYLSTIKMLQNIDKEDLETLWKLIKTKHGNTRPEDEYERVLCGDLKVMFEHDIKSEVWRNLQGYKVTVWKLLETVKVHFVRLRI
ncbi:hypothetical protein Tco_0565259 [Tanacetum coccineum]